MIRLFWVVAIVQLATAVPSAAQGIPPDVRLYLENVQLSRTEYLPVLKRTMASADAAIKSARAQGDTGAVQRLNATKAGTRLEIERLSSVSAIPYLVHPFAVGKIGVPYSIKVIQVIDENTMLASVMPYGYAEAADAWIEGMPTKGIVDGAEIQPPIPFHIEGTKTYDTANGATRTVHRLIAFDVSRVKAEWAKEFFRKK